MSIYRRAAKVDSTQAEIVAGLEAAHVKCWPIRMPCDLLCRYFHPKLQGYVWQTLEVKTPYGKKAPKARVDKRQEAQRIFLEETHTPIVTSLGEALLALGLT